MKQQKSWSPKSVLSPSPVSGYSIEPEISNQLQINMFLPPYAETQRGGVTTATQFCNKTRYSCSTQTPLQGDRINCTRRETKSNNRL